jgi:hypothetical protein
MPKNQRPKRHLYNNQTVPGMQGLETITPVESTVVVDVETTVAGLTNEVEVKVVV